MSNWENIIKVNILSGTLGLLIFSIALLFPLHALSRMDQVEKKVMVLCSWKQEGPGLDKSSQDITPSRELTSSVSGYLSQNGFNVVDPVDAGLSEEDHTKFMKTYNQKSSARELAKRFEVDVVGFVYLDASITKNSNGSCKVKGALIGKGYDNRGVSLGSGLNRTYQVTRQDCEETITEYQREAAFLIISAFSLWRKSLLPPLK
jgi:hypothetical protein